MQQRIITGVCLIILVLSCMFLIPVVLPKFAMIPMFILMLAIAGIAGFEWYRLMPAKDDSSRRRPSRQRQPREVKQSDAILYGVIVAWVSALPLACVWLIGGGTVFAVMKYILLICVLFWCVTVYWMLNYPKEQDWYNQSLYVSGCILIASAVFSMFFLWNMSKEYLLYVFLLVWGADTGAYFVGRQFGQNKLCPEVSPNKTVEGLIGGVITTVIIMLLIVAFGSIQMSLGQWAIFIVIAILTVFASIQGDLFESMIKRSAGIKDSGTILPGHGGVLDRVDSLLSATPVFLLGLYVLELLGVAV